MRERYYRLNAPFGAAHGIPRAKFTCSTQSRLKDYGADLSSVDAQAAMSCVCFEW